MENAYIIRGGTPLKGTIRLSGAKNVALKVIIASLLLDHPVTLTNVPHILDIQELLHLVTQIGGKAHFIADHTVEIDGSTIKSDKVDLLHASKIRVSFLLFAPLLVRFGKTQIPNPGGCRLGARPIDRQVEMMRAFGVKATYDSSTGFYTARLTSSSLTPAHFTFSKPTHTGTELALMLAAATPGESIIENVAQEPEIDDLIRFLNLAGASIKRQRTAIAIKGATSFLRVEKPFTISVDRNEAPTYAIFGLATKGDVFIQGIRVHDISYFIDKVREANGGVEESPGGVRFFYKKELKNTDITTLPHPGFMTDWQAPWAVLMTQATGISTIHETVFENRFGYVSELLKLGAKIDFFQPEVGNPYQLYQFNIDSPGELKTLHQAIRIQGQTKLHNGVLNVSDLRAGASLLIGTSVADGESVIYGASVIDRGYEAIDVKLKQLGADIRKV